LPPVALVQVGESYYCLDGHHRISVAHAFQQQDIEAKVTVWQVEGPLPGAAPERSSQTQAGVAGTLQKNAGEGGLHPGSFVPAWLRASRAAAH
jgi:hypothetical protein